MNQVLLENGLDIVQMVVTRNGIVVLAENVDLRPVYATGFELLLNSFQIVKICAYIEMPFHRYSPVITSCKSEYACHQAESSTAQNRGLALVAQTDALFQTTDSC